MRIFSMMMMMILFMSCVKNKNFQNAENANQVSENANVFEVKEVIQTSSYSYLKVTEKGNERWVAVSKQDINAGDVYYYEGSLQMTNFQSKELNRTFDEVYFLNQISKTPFAEAAAAEAMAGMPAHSGKVNTEQNSAITLEKQAGEITVAQVFANRAEYEGKEIEIRGIVVKVNKEVMGKNWIHIQDGTNDNGNFDLTITSMDLPALNDEVTFKGKITLKKDFGAGYYYDVIMEEATLQNKKAATAAM